jgi:predicted kinase
MPNLVVLIGVPGSGKSTVAAQFQSLGYPVISTDQIRAELFGDAAIQGDWPLIWQQVEQRFRQASQQSQRANRQANQQTLAVYDATNARRRGRREVIRLAHQTGFRLVLGFWLNPPLAICLERNRQRPRFVPEAVIRRMHQQIRSSPPRLSEGLDLLVHYGDPVHAIDVTDWLTSLQIGALADQNRRSRASG